MKRKMPNFVEHGKILALALLFPSLAAAQQQQPRLEFEVASIKASKTDFQGQRFRSDRGALEIINMEPSTLIENAYQIPLVGQLVGVPRWADEEIYDIQAKADEPNEASIEEARQHNLLRLQSLLASRFQLRAHWEPRMLQGYVLSVSKSGPRLKASRPGAASETRQGRGRLRCWGCGVPNLQVFLSNYLKQPVSNDTGLEGLYDIDLEFEPLNSVSSDGKLPSLFTVLQDQLGLKLEARKIPVQVLVVDHIERPTPN